MVYVTILIPLYIDTLLTPLLCIPRTFFYYLFHIPLIFSTCSNPRHVSHRDIFSAHDTISTSPTPSVLYHYYIRFSSNLPSLPSPSNPPPFPVLQFHPIISFSFDSVVHSFGSQLILWSGSIVQHCMLETSDFYFYIVSFPSPSPTSSLQSA